MKNPLVIHSLFCSLLLASSALAQSSDGFDVSIFASDAQGNVVDFHKRMDDWRCTPYVSTQASGSVKDGAGNDRVQEDQRNYQYSRSGTSSRVQLDSTSVSQSVHVTLTYECEKSELVPRVTINEDGDIVTVLDNVTHHRRLIWSCRTASMPIGDETVKLSCSGPQGSNDSRSHGGIAFGGEDGMSYNFGGQGVSWGTDGRFLFELFSFGGKGQLDAQGRQQVQIVSSVRLANQKMTYAWDNCTATKPYKRLIFLNRGLKGRQGENDFVLQVTINDADTVKLASRNGIYAHPISYCTSHPGEELKIELSGVEVDLIWDDLYVAQSTVIADGQSADCESVRLLRKRWFGEHITDVVVNISGLNPDAAETQKLLRAARTVNRTGQCDPSQVSDSIAKELAYRYEGNGEAQGNVTDPR